MKTICFVQRKPGIRVYMQAKALNMTKKYKLILICERCDYQLMEGVFDKIIFYGLITEKKHNNVLKLCNYFFDVIFGFGEKQLKAIIKNTNADIFHAHAEPNDIPRIVMENATGKVIFDGQDFTGISSGIDYLGQKIKEDERFCFENADGICHKGPRLEIDYYRNHGYRITCPELQWMGCCNEDFFVNLETEKRSYMDKEIHLVYAGSISPDTRYEYKYFIPTAENIVKNKIHFHIYPSSPTEERFSEYRNLEKQERYFHFHKHAPYKLLIKEMSQYDFGVLFERDIRGDRFIEEKAKTGMATKLFSYMEAGIPSIVNSHIETAKNFVEMNGIGFSLRENDFDRLRNLINIFDLEKFKKTIKKMRRYWSADNQVVYLERFYDSVLNN